MEMKHIWKYKWKYFLVKYETNKCKYKYIKRKREILKDMSRFLTYLLEFLFLTQE